jgi:hypothetical protein
MSSTEPETADIVFADTCGGFTRFLLEDESGCVDVPDWFRKIDLLGDDKHSIDPKESVADERSTSIDVDEEEAVDNQDAVDDQDAIDDDDDADDADYVDDDDDDDEDDDADDADDAGDAGEWESASDDETGDDKDATVDVDSNASGDVIEPIEYLLEVKTTPGLCSTRFFMSDRQHRQVGSVNPNPSRLPFFRLEVGSGF